MNQTTHDPLAHASEIPNVDALVTEFELAQTSGVCHPSHIAAAENVRYNRWQGKSDPPDGCRWQKNQGQGKVARPYDGAPDTDVQLCDELILAEVDIKMTSWKMAQIGATTTHTTPLTAAQAAELKSVAEWVRRVTAVDLRDDLELLAQMDSMLGWGVLNPGWLERWELVRREIDLESIKVAASQAPPRSILAALPTMILDPEFEASTIEFVQVQFPHMDKREARRVVRELREQGHTSFLDRQLVEKRPTCRTLIQGYNYFVAGGAGKLKKARGHLVIERFYQADLEATAAANGWNPEFVERVIPTAGMYSAYGDAMRDKTQNNSADEQDRSIEIWTTHVLQFDPDTGASGIYCTTFSPHVRPGAAGAKPEHYAKHYLLAFAHGEPPFIQTRREVIGPSVEDSRGVPDMVRSDQKVIKNLQDAGVTRAHLEVDPPRALIGAGWTKSGDGLKPGAMLTMAMPGAEVRELGPSKGNPQFAEVTIGRVTDGTRRRFALPNNTDGSHPSAWQMRQMRASDRWLQAGEEAFWQMVVLTYQELSPEELAMIIGHPPQLTVVDLLRHRITLTFDARALDQDWINTVLDFVIRLLGIDSGGLMDRGPIIQMALSYIDPTIIQSIMRNPAGAQAALYRKVEQDVASMMLGNPAPMVEMDPTAQMQMQMAFAVVGKNQKYQSVIQSDQQVREQLTLYLKNLEHSHQQTQLSPMQGRLGVDSMPQKPVQKGSSMDTMMTQ